MSPRRSVLIATLAAIAGCASQQQSAAQTPRRELFLFQYSPGPAWREGVPMREQGLGPHGAYMQQLLNEGRLFAGGGYTSDDGGMAIVLAANIDEARAILAADPAITSGIFTAELRHWRPRFYSNDPLMAPP
jgi:uncharacterized protein YciI